MLEVALLNPRQHKQFCCDSGPLVLARSLQEPALWTIVGEGETCRDAHIEIMPQRPGVSLIVEGCDAQHQENRSRNPIVSGHLQLPARFTVGDTRFEITLAKSDGSRRPLQV